MALQKIVGSNISPATAALIRSLQFQSPSSYISLPVGTTAQRPTGVSYGTIRFNTTKDQAEIYNTQTGIPDWNTIGSETGIDGGDAFIRTNGTTITKDITLGPTANSDQKYTHGFLMGDITIDSGITVTIETGSQLIIIDEQPIQFTPETTTSLYSLYFPSGSFLLLDATLYSPGSSTWQDTSGNERNYTVNPTAYITNGKFFDFNGNYGIAKNSSDISLNGDVTYIVVTRVKKSQSEWRTLTRSYVNDHHVIFESGSWRMGMYDNDSVGYLNTGKLQTELPHFYDNEGKFDIMIWRWTNSDNPTYDLNVNGVQIGTITNSNARYNRGFGSIGGYHNGSTNTNVNDASQYWGDIKFFAAFNRRLSDQEVANANLALTEYVNDISTKLSTLTLWELDLRGITASQYTNNTTFSSSDTGYTRYGFNLNGTVVNGLMQNHTSASSTSKVPVTFSSPKSKVFFITWYYKSSYNSGTTGGLLSATPTLFSQNYTIHPGGVYRDGSSSDSLIFETNPGTSEFTTAAGTRYRLSSGLNNYASGWHSLGYLFDSTSTSVGIYVNGNFIQNITHSGTFGNFTGAQLAPWNFYSGYTTTDACMAYSICVDAATLDNKQIKQIADRGLLNLIVSQRLGSIIGI